MPPAISSGDPNQSLREMESRRNFASVPAMAAGGRWDRAMNDRSGFVRFRRGADVVIFSRHEPKSTLGSRSGSERSVSCLLRVSTRPPRRHVVAQGTSPTRHPPLSPLGASGGPCGARSWAGQDGVI
jgi:hypothetical protein